MITDRTTYIFIDYENVQSIDLSLIIDKPVKVVLASGKLQTTFPKSLVIQLVAFADQVELVDNEHPGKNALDFVIVFEIARRALQDPKGYFQIVSKDKGFDALVKYLRTLGILASRIEDFSKIRALMDPLKMTPAQRADRYLEHLTLSTNSRPAKKQTLLSQLGRFFGQRLTDENYERVLKDLVEAGHLSISESGKVTYQL